MASNVIPLRRPSANPGYAPGVVPFDPQDPVHVREWNTLFQIGWSEQRFAQYERQNRHSSLEIVK